MNLPLYVEYWIYSISIFGKFDDRQLHKIVKNNALIKKYGNPYSKEKENNKALWIMDYEKACKLNEKNEKFFENI